MVELSSFAAAIASLRTAGEIAKAMIGMRDAQAMQAEIIKLQTSILAAQQHALIAQADQSSLLERLREMERLASEAENWAETKTQYEMAEVGDGVTVYRLKPDLAAAQPNHLLCPKCFHEQKFSIIQRTGTAKMYHHVHACPTCKTEYVFGRVPRRPTPTVVSNARDW